MKLSDFLLFPTEKTVTGDGLDLTLFDNDGVDNPDVIRYLDMLVRADSRKEVQMILTLLWNDAMAGEVKMDVGKFGEIIE